MRFNASLLALTLALPLAACGESDGTDEPNTLADDIEERELFTTAVRYSAFGVFSGCDGCLEFWSARFTERADGSHAQEFRVYTQADASTTPVLFCTETANRTYATIDGFDGEARILATDTYTSTDCPNATVGNTRDSVYARLEGGPFAVAYWEPDAEAGTTVSSSGLKFFGHVPLEEATISAAYVACDDSSADYCLPLCEDVSFGGTSTCPWTQSP
jgi:hypothetical protein